MKDVFYRKCDECGRQVAIDEVSEFHNVGGFRGYMFTMMCPCGMYTSVIGNTGDKIPESMKLAAARKRENPHARD